MPDCLLSFQMLPDNDLSNAERKLILMRIDDLLRMLGAPGDWGYGTKIGELTRILHIARASIVEDTHG